MSGNESDDENSDDNEEFKVNLGDTSPNSCVEALDWDTKSKQKSSDRTLKTVKQKSFMYIVMQLCLKVYLFSSYYSLSINWQLSTTLFTF